MRSLKICLILGLAILLISNFGCDVFKIGEVIDNGNGDDDGPKFITDVVIGYERLEPFKSTDYFDSHVNLNVHTNQAVTGWSPIQNTKMQKTTSDKEFEYVAGKLPYETRLYMYTQDWGRSNAGGPEFNGELFKVLGQQLTREKGFVRGDPMGNNNEVAAFIIKKDNTVAPW